MKRKLPLLLSVFGALGLAAGDAAAQAKYNLRWGHYLADSPFVQLEKDFANQIEKRTNGQVKITITFAQGLGKTTELLTLTAKGAIDMTATAPGYNPDQLHYWRAFQLPLTFETSKQAMHVLGAVVKEFPIYRQEMNRAGVEWLFQQPLGEYYLSGSSPECDSVPSLRGKKIRSFGADIPKALEAAGAVPVSVGVGEVYEALQRGTLDYSWLNFGNILSNRLHEVGKYSCGPVMSITGHLIVIGQDSWDRLPEDIQKIFLEEAEKHGKLYIDDIETADRAMPVVVIFALRRRVRFARDRLWRPIGARERPHVGGQALVLWLHRRVAACPAFERRRHDLRVGDHRAGRDASDRHLGRRHRRRRRVLLRGGAAGADVHRGRRDVRLRGRSPPAMTTSPSRSPRLLLATTLILAVVGVAVLTWPGQSGSREAAAPAHQAATFPSSHRSPSSSSARPAMKWIGASSTPVSPVTAT